VSVFFVVVVYTFVIQMTVGLQVCLEVVLSRKRDVSAAATCIEKRNKYYHFSDILLFIESRIIDFLLDVILKLLDTLEIHVGTHVGNLCYMVNQGSLNCSNMKPFYVDLRLITSI
jgi:hypothetical protein